MQNLLRLSFLSVFTVLILSFSQAQSRLTYPTNLVQLHNNVWEEVLGNNKDLNTAKSIADQLNDKGQWPDIDYTSKQRGSWPTTDHLNRVASMARAYQKQGTAFYHNADLKNKILLSLNYWLVNVFRIQTGGTPRSVYPCI